MKMFVIFILIFSSFQNTIAQTDESIISEIANDLLDCSTEVNDTMFLEKNIGKTFYNDDSISMNNQTDLQIPQKILAEIISNSKEVKESYWNEDRLNQKFIVVSKDNDTDFVSRRPYVKCLSKYQLDSISIHSPALQVYSISRLVFDNDKQTGIFRIEYSIGGKYFLLNVF